MTVFSMLDISFDDSLFMLLILQYYLSLYTLLDMKNQRAEMPSRLDISDGPKLLHIDAKAKPTPTYKQRCNHYCNGRVEIM